MATNIQQNVVELSTTPTNGQPWNFNSLLKSLLLPWVIASDSSLLPGARLLWAVIRQCAGENGYCAFSDKALAEKVGVSDRQIRRYCHQLGEAGLLRTTPRPGRTPVRELLWDGRFVGIVRKPPVTDVRPPGHAGPPPRTSVSGLYKEEGNLTVVNRSKTAAIEKVVPGNAPSLPPRPRPPVRTDEEIIRRGRECNFPEHVIQRDLERARARRASEEAEPVVTPSYLANEGDPSIPR